MKNEKMRKHKTIKANKEIKRKKENWENRKQ